MFSLKAVCTNQSRGYTTVIPLGPVWKSPWSGLPLSGLQGSVISSYVQTLLVQSTTSPPIWQMFIAFENYCSQEIYHPMVKVVMSLSLYTQSGPQMTHIQSIAESVYKDFPRLIGLPKLHSTSKTWKLKIVSMLNEVSKDLKGTSCSKKKVGFWSENLGSIPASAIFSVWLWESRLIANNYSWRL